MSSNDKHSLDTGVSWMRAAGELTRMRLLALLDQADLTVSDLVEILDQSQPRISRHLKLLVDAGLAQRFQEGAWALFRTADSGQVRVFLDTIIKPLASDDPVLMADLAKLDKVRQARAKRAAAYFADNAEEWNKIRSLHVHEEDIEQRMLQMGLEHKPKSILDMGTGTGRVLQLFGPRVDRGVGIDSSADMLALARSELARSGEPHLQVRRGDVYNIPAGEKYDLIVLHQVLHFLETPQLALEQAREHLTENGRILVVDLEPHDLEFLRQEHAHLRLGVSLEQMSIWMDETDLELVQLAQIEPEQSDKEILSVLLWLIGKKAS